MPRALTDGERLATGELVYSGLTRTDVSVVARTVLFRGHRQRLAAGNFATMADVRRILGELPDDVDQHETADHRGTSLEESLARFARCLGRDRRDASLADWRSAAALIAAEQMDDLPPGTADAPAIWRQRRSTRPPSPPASARRRCSPSPSRSDDWRTPLPKSPTQRRTARNG